MSKNSTGYLFFFAAMVTLVAGVALAVAATVLKPLQEKNKALEKKKFILSAIGYTDEELKDQQAIDLAYNETITEKVVTEEGKEIEGVNAFEIIPIDEQKLEGSNPDYTAKLPLYEYTGPKGSTYVIPLTGKGLWGPIFGYIAVNKDFSRVKGVIFDHDKETPGLGAEITALWFQEQFVGKKFIDDKDRLYSIQVLKGSGNDTTSYEVDGISGATITSKGVMDMLKKDLGRYYNYFSNKQ